jgi:hypothetical protein
LQLSAIDFTTTNVPPQTCVTEASWTRNDWVCDFNCVHEILIHPMIVTRPQQFDLEDYGEAHLHVEPYKGEWHIVQRVHESDRLTIPGELGTNPDEYHERSETRFLARTRREMKFLGHGEEFPYEIKTMHFHLGIIQGRTMALSPYLSPQEIEKQSRSAFLLECSDIVLKKVRWT